MSMKITSSINGEEMEFELTPSELQRAYWKYNDKHEWECALEDVENYLEEHEITATERQREDIASHYLKYKDNCDCWTYVLENAVNDMLPRERG